MYGVSTLFNSNIGASFKAECINVYKKSVTLPVSLPTVGMVVFISRTSARGFMCRARGKNLTVFSVVAR